jgi:site-specific DNA-methyltransferase (adenine-specific)
MNRLFSQMLNRVTCGDCVDVLAHLPRACVDFTLTDPPYLVNYRDRQGRRVANDDNDAWLKPAFAQIHRVLKPDSLCVSFYGWDKVDLFMGAWRAAGFRPVGQIIFCKPYASSVRYLSYRHEGAYLLAKGFPPFPDKPPPDVMGWEYSGNRLHPTQKPVATLKPLIAAFTKPGAVVLDPFAGSGSPASLSRPPERRVPVC